MLCMPQALPSAVREAVQTGKTLHVPAVMPAWPIVAIAAMPEAIPSQPRMCVTFSQARLEARLRSVWCTARSLAPHRVFPVGASEMGFKPNLVAKCQMDLRSPEQ